MREESNNGFWDLLIWVAVLMAGTFVLAGLLLHLVGAGWVKLVFLLMGLAGLVWITRRETRESETRASVGKLSLTETVTVISTALAFFPIVFLPDDENFSLTIRIVLLVLCIPLQTYGLYRSRLKKEAEARKEEAEQREPLELRDRVARTASGAFIVISHARQVDLEFELDDRMFLYRLPDGRFLVLFRKDVDLDVFQGTLSDFRSEVDADEDVLGYYGLSRGGNRPDAPRAFHCNLQGECRPVSFNPSTVPISSAVPV